MYGCHEASEPDGTRVACQSFSGPPTSLNSLELSEKRAYNQRDASHVPKLLRIANGLSLLWNNCQSGPMNNVINVWKWRRSSRRVIRLIASGQWITFDVPHKSVMSPTESRHKDGFSSERKMEQTSWPTGGMAITFHLSSPKPSDFPLIIISRSPRYCY